jgi:hypothetical protein
MKRESPWKMCLGIFLRAHMKLEEMCLLRWTLPNWPSSKYFRTSKSFMESGRGEGRREALEPMRWMAAMVRISGEEQVVDAVVLRQSAILSDLDGLSSSREKAYN